MKQRNRETEATGRTITDDQRQQLDELGFFVTDRLFDASVLTEVADAFHTAWQAQIADFDRRNVQQDGIVNPRQRPFLANIRRTQPVCRAFCRHPALVAIAGQLLGRDVDLTWDQAIIKPPHTQSAFGWHQDMWYAENGDYLKTVRDLERFRDNTTGITAWIAISDTTVANGTLRVLPGFHKKGLLPHEWNHTTNDWQGQYDDATAVAVELKAGQCILFRKYLPHASGGNTTDIPRMAYQVGYNQAGIVNPDSSNVSPLLRTGELLEDA